MVSGGHTMSVFVRGVGDYQIIGRTVDDAAGEAFDKIAKLLGSVTLADRRSRNTREAATRNVLICREACRIRKISASAA